MLGIIGDGVEDADAFRTADAEAFSDLRRPDAFSLQLAHLLSLGTRRVSDCR
jgi:hypothetical protein